MTLALDEELRSIRTKISAVQARKARAEVMKENAQAALKQARSTLAEEYGVSTPADAKTVLTELSDELEKAVAQVRQELEAAGA